MDSELKDNITMEYKEIITDELIAKYISGKTNEEEDRLIHDYLAQNPEFADDLLDIATALKHQHKHDAAIKKDEQEESKEAKRIQITPRRTFYAVAASVVLLIGVGLLVFKPFARKEKMLFIAESGYILNSSPDSVASSNMFLRSSSNKKWVLCSDSIVSVEPEQPLIVFGASSPQRVQKTVNTILPLPEEQYLANNPQDIPSEQEPVLTSQDDNPSTMASLTVYDDNGNALNKKDAVFNIEYMPESCNPEKDLVLKWTCNAPSLKLELSSDRVTWKTLNNNIANQNSRTLNSNLLKDYELSNPKCFYWRMTGKYSDGNQTWQGKIKFSRENN